MKYQNTLTANIVKKEASFITPPTTKDAFPQLVLFNAVIAVLFSMSYMNWENRKKKVILKIY